MSEQNQSESGRRDSEWDIEWRREVGTPIFWALILIWAGLIFLAEHLGWVVGWSWWSPWGMIFLGAGAILILGGLIRFAIQKFRWGAGGNMFLGFIFLCIGAGMLGGWSLIWPLALIALGIGWIVSVLLRQQR